MALLRLHRREHEVPHADGPNDLHPFPPGVPFVPPYIHRIGVDMQGEALGRGRHGKADVHSVRRVLDAFRAAAPRLAGKLLTEREIDSFLADGYTVTLTDRYAPVDQMLLPVFLDQVPR